MNMPINMKLHKFSFAVLTITFSQMTFAATEQSTAEPSEPKVEIIELQERIQIIGHNKTLRKESGSATLLDELMLEKFKFDDLNRVLYNVPGVNIREEDGYGLRPNIGFRGATPERSKKISVMEDRVLIGPAPYSAPAAYYFPMMSKMTSIEVFKGPAAIKYGPNTVAGAINMTTRQIPVDAEGAIDLAIGSDGYGKVKAHFGTTNGKFGYLVEGAHIQADGFKELDGGGDTGFSKNDIMTKLKYDFSSSNYKQVVELKYSYATEESNETYLGLTDSDFEKNPNRRYVSSQHDLMDWNHQQVQLTHFIAGTNFDITTQIYRNEFERSWNKISGFKDGLINRDLQEILANPEDEVNAAFYQVLTGQRNSEQEYEKIILGDNAREYLSQGIQTELYTSFSLFDFNHTLNTGIRFHQDQINRYHTEEVFMMQNFSLTPDDGITIPTTTNLEKTDAIAVFIEDTISLYALDLTLGLLGEFFDSYYQNQAPDQEGDWLKKETSILLPSISGFYTLNKHAGILFGIHEGFIPTSPRQGPEVDVENSINYEFGGRYNNGNASIEAIFFYNDIQNLKESCSFSTASSCGNDLDAEYNSGEASVYGLEFSSAYTHRLNNGLDMPLSLVYTYTSSEFKSDFNSDFPMWGNVIAGDALPYLPDHQVTANIGLMGDLWEVNVLGRYIDDMLEASGDGVTLSNVSTKAYTTIDVSGSYDFNSYGLVYFKAINLLDTQEIVSRRPYGARPSKNRQFQLGYQYNF
jgi:Fe(3+) dicitrate transport protein